LTNTFSQFTIP